MAKAQHISNEPLLGYERSLNVNEDDKEKISSEHHESPEDTEVESVGRVSTLETVSGVAGTLLEWYDFALFGFFSDVIGEVFFPPQTGNRAIAESFLVFGSAFMIRPVGGLLMGYIGDTFGRKRALVTSIFLMVFPTFIMGCLPSYSRVGGFALVLLVIVRLVQGISVGGQLISSAMFTMESRGKEKWGLYGSSVLSVAESGTLLGSLVATGIRGIFTHEQLVSFGWRIPFWIGILGVIPGVVLKCCIKDRPIPDQDLSAGDQTNNPIKRVFCRAHRRALISCMLVTAFLTGVFYLNFVWMPIFMTDLLELPLPHAFAINSSALFVYLLTGPPIGVLSDYCGHGTVMLVGMITTMVLGPVMVHVITISGPATAFLAQACLAVTMRLGTSPLFALTAKSFPSVVRLTGVGFAYNVATALVGGTIPALATYLVDRYGIRAPGYIFTAVSIIGITGLCVAPKMHEDDENVESRVIENGTGDERIIQ
mmetsp:Transcript_19632/g.28852  ORF Transcript_19632/g.28852 Transcript_19632/m.28852 type:complete len:483 (-) Transcript_19632:129-1577(-)|eukprot:CAMPEP_0195522324 /NCGR_PEP_ID=MMETSP0794_2-20130614/20386_1 /TAXON_ID=515487 /ORGANISM="Stephanopyxis turris, Strain CCMP 815" /LENGTH=482 /DNA_ID=CAMNT_0040652053 /DNA_START=59 /DNA_END=1507 /DNA_ORIENTATION=+